jgi:hypothetical protein
MRPVIGIGMTATTVRRIDLPLGTYTKQLWQFGFPKLTN